MVYEADGGVPQLCAFVSADTPQPCTGIDLIDWSWDLVDDEQSDGDQTWGTAVVVGTFEGAALRVSNAGPPEWGWRLPSTGSSAVGADAGVDARQRCEPPAGGWAVADPAKASTLAWEAAHAYVEAAPDFAYSWTEPAAVSAPLDFYGYEATAGVWHITFTDNVAGYETVLRSMWGGPICVTRADYSKVELETLSESIASDVPDAFSVVADGVSGTVIVQTWFDRGLGDELRGKHGDAIVVDPVMVPLATDFVVPDDFYR